MYGLLKFLHEIGALDIQAHLLSPQTSLHYSLESLGAREETVIPWDSHSKGCLGVFRAQTSTKFL